MDTPKRKYQKHKTDYTISVKYFAKKRLNPTINQNGVPIYPIYVRVVCKRQNTTIPSRLKSDVPEGELEEYLNKPIIRDLVKSETESILAAVESLKPDTPGFTLGNLSHEYAYHCQEVFNSCYQVIMYRLSLAFEQLGIEKGEYETLTVDTFKSLKFMMSLGVPTAKELYERYSPIAEIRNYEQRFRKKYQTYFTFGLSDCNTGLYRVMLTDTVGDEGEAIFELVQELGNEYFSLPFDFKKNYHRRFVRPILFQL